MAKLNCCQKKEEQPEQVIDFVKTRPWAEMSPAQRKERINYLRFRMKVIALASSFLLHMKKSNAVSFEFEISHTHQEVWFDDEESAAKLEFLSDHGK